MLCASGKLLVWALHAVWDRLPMSRSAPNSNADHIGQMRPTPIGHQERSIVQQELVVTPCLFYAIFYAFNECGHAGG